MKKVVSTLDTLEELKKLLLEVKRQRSLSSDEYIEVNVRKRNKV